MTDDSGDISFEFDFTAKRNVDPRAAVEPPSLNICPAPRPWSSEIDMAGDVKDKLSMIVAQAGPGGITKPQLAVSCTTRSDQRVANVQSELRLDTRQLAGALAGLSDSSDSPVFWAGFDTARLVSRAHWSQWLCPAVTYVQNESGQFIKGGGEVVWCTPRKWVDIWGRRLEEVWTQSVDCAKGWLMSRPGMTEVSPSPHSSIDVSDEDGASKLMRT